VFVLPVSILVAIATRSAVVGLDVRAIFDPEQAPAFGGIVAVYAAAAVQSLALALAAGPIAHVVLADRVAIAPRIDTGRTNTEVIPTVAARWRRTMQNDSSSSSTSRIGARSSGRSCASAWGRRPVTT
jgi:hypothetical protein